MHLKVAATVLVGALSFAKAKVITVPAVDPSIRLDQFFGLDDDEPGCDPTYFTKEPNSAALFDFVGTEISLIGSTSSRGGVYDVYLDQKLESTVDRYANSVKLQCGLVTFSKKNLPYVQHNLRVVFRQNSTNAMPDAGAGYFDFSAIQYAVPEDADPSVTYATNVGVATGTASAAAVAKKSAPIGAIVGGIVGGVVGLGVMAFLIWFLVFRKKKDTTNVDMTYDNQGDKGQYVMPFSPPTTTVTPGFDHGALPYQPSPPPVVTGYHPHPQPYQPQPFQWDANSNNNYMNQHNTGTVTTGPLSPTLTGSGRDSVAYKTDVSSPIPFKSDSLSPSPPYPAPSHSPVSPDGTNMMGGYQHNLPMGAAQPLPQEEIQRIAQAVLLHSAAHEDPAGPPAYR
ncbi:hypothetical protein FRC03_000325 [Tulasnella sp. 419]|nr:hypothetical protein FRC03_000325 [Tulasnella sp. 419]